MKNKRSRGEKVTFSSKTRFPSFFYFPNPKNKERSHDSTLTVLDEPERRRGRAEALAAHVDAVLAHEPPVVAADAAGAPALGVVVVVRVPDVGVAHLECFFGLGLGVLF